MCGLTVLGHAPIIVFECNERTIRWKKEKKKGKNFMNDGGGVIRAAV